MTLVQEANITFTFTSDCCCAHTLRITIDHHARNTQEGFVGTASNNNGQRQTRRAGSTEPKCVLRRQGATVVHETLCASKMNIEWLFLS